MKEKVEKNLFREISKEAYKEFVENLKEFWLEDLREFKPERGFTLTIRFMSAGLTAASVFRCEVDICGDIATPKVVVCKYDEKENIEIESQNFRMVIKSGESVFPDIQKAQAFENGMALLTMRSAIESKSAITVFSAIKFILDKYGQNERMLEFYAKVFANHTGIVYRDMRDKLYHTPNAHWTSQDSFRGLYAGKTDLKVLDDKTKASPNGTFSERLKKVCLDTGLEYESFLNFLSTFPDCRALLSGVAIHKDLNPNNILLAIGEDSDRNEIISPMLIDFFEMQYKENERGENWLPLLFDFSRFEAQMFLYYFSYLSKSSNSKEVFFQSFKRLIDALNRGRLVKINSADPAVISNEALSYIFTIFFKLRGYVFRDLAELGIEKKLIYQNYLSSLSSFYFSFLKMDKEEAFQDKWNFSLLAADTCRKNIIELTDKLDYDSIYRESKSDRLHIGDSMMALLERKRYHHIALSDNLQKVKDFLHSDKQILYIESSPGMGKSSFLAYICDALNDNIPESELPGNVFCIPVFFDDKDKAKVKERETNRALKTKEEQNIELNFQDIADYFVQILCAAFHKVDKAPEEKSTDRFIRLCHEIYPELEQKKQQVVFLVDALDRNFIELEHYVLTNRLPGRFQYILSSRPQNPRWESFYNEQRQFFRSETYKLAEFSKDDIRALFQEWKVSPELTEEEAALLHEKTGGYPIYVEFIRRLLVAEKGRAAKMRREELKERLHSFSKEGFERELFDYYDELVKSKNKIVKQVLFCLVLAKDYLSAAHLARILYEELEREYHTDIEADLIDVLKDDILPVIREVLEYDENQNFRIFHRSYERYLEEKYQGKGGLRDFRATFFRYLKQYRDYAENEEERVHFLYCKNYLGLHLYEWAQSEKSYQEKFDTIFAEIFSMEEEEYRLWKKPLKAMVYWMMENQPYNETEFMLTFLKSQIPAIFSYRYFLFLTEIIEKKKNKGYDTTWNASLHFLNLELIQALSKSEPNNSLYKRDISVSYNRLADVYVSRGETDKALKHFTESLLIAEQLSNSEPNNTQYKRDIVHSLIKKGNILIFKGDVGKAKSSYEKALSLINVDVIDVSIFFTKLKAEVLQGLVTVSMMDSEEQDSDKIFSYSLEALSLWEKLKEEYGTIDIQVLNGLGKSNFLLAVLSGNLETGEQRKYIHKAIKNLLEVHKIQADNPDVLMMLSNAYSMLGNDYLEKEETEKAREVIEKSINYSRALVEKFPENYNYKQSIIFPLISIAQLEDDESKAIEYLKEAYETIIALEKKGYHIPGIEEMKNWIQSVIEGNEE
ncbi:MAG: tetratricopeptide repeat protein [Leptospiraceae bacterium]|nr:tetratricopeptide repeat protein [Leptospiraceae bacterium]